MAGKNKGGRETRKPKADHNKKTKGQTPPRLIPEADATNRVGKRPH